jgi:hypothetical protein
MIHDHNASVASLARVMLGDVDAREFTQVRSASLKLILETLIQLAEPRHHMQAADSAVRTVAGHLQAVEEVKERIVG